MRCFFIPSPCSSYLCYNDGIYLYCPHFFSKIGWYLHIFTKLLLYEKYRCRLCHRHRWKIFHLLCTDSADCLDLHLTALFLSCLSLSSAPLLQDIRNHLVWDLKTRAAHRHWFDITFVKADPHHRHHDPRHYQT